NVSASSSSYFPTTQRAYNKQLLSNCLPTDVEQLLSSSSSTNVQQQPQDLTQLEKQVTPRTMIPGAVFPELPVDNVLESKSQLSPQLSKLYRRSVGRPRVEKQCPDSLQIIEEIAKVGNASDDRRRSETIRPCLTLDDLREKIKQRGYDIKRTTLYYRLLLHRTTSIEGRRHTQTVPVRLRRAQLFLKMLRL
ncbi:unnamed protein product, partial [Adineta steineri]